MTTPQVSVIIPTCNRRKLLPTAVGSVLNQTFRDFELVVVDDASDDSLDDVVRAFQDKRVRWIRHEHRRGGAAARNTGIVSSKCDYIAFLDDDDEWFPDKLARQMAVLLAGPPEVGCVYTGYITVDRGSGKELGQMIPAKRGDLSKELLSSNCIGGTSSSLMRRKCFERVGLFDETLPSFQDYDLWIRISREFRFDYIEEPLLKYYVHQKKIWSDVDALLNGMQIMLRKYGDSPDFQKYMSYQYLTLGVSCCYKGNMDAARKSYIQAIRLYPFEIRHYFNLCLSLLGPAWFVEIKEAKAGVMTELRQKSPMVDPKENSQDAEGQCDHHYL